MWQVCQLISMFFAVMLTVLLPTSLARADLTIPGPGVVLFTHDKYDYAPSVMFDGSVYKFWWCGMGSAPNPDPNRPNEPQDTDVIYYRSYDPASSTWSVITKVLTPTPGAFDKVYTCDPSVVKGTFNVGGQTYTYAMYYSGAAAAGNSQVGAAFSNNGITWTKYPNPVVYPLVYQSPLYGAGQPSAYNYNGASGIYLFYTDQCNGTDRVFVRSSTDGITFGNFPTLVSNTGINADAQGFMGNTDFGYDPNAAKFNVVVPVLGRAQDRDSNGFGFYRLDQAQVIAVTSSITCAPNVQVPTSSGTWETLGFVDTNLNSFYLNSSAGLTRDERGRLPTLPALTATFGAGVNDPLSWDLTYATWDNDPPTMPLRRYWNGSDHLSTTGYQPTGYNVEGPTQGYLLMAPKPNTQKLWACKAGSDYFASLERGCGLSSDPQRLIGLNGYIYVRKPIAVNTVRLFSCYTNTSIEYFTSTDANCEGQTVQGPLGYIATSP